MFQDASSIGSVKLFHSDTKFELYALNSLFYVYFQSYSNSTIGRPRCNSPEKLKQFGCLPQEIRTSSAGTIEFIKDLNFQDMEPERIPIQLRPQRIKVMIPPHSEITIPIRYRLAKYVRLTDNPFPK